MIEANPTARLLPLSCPHCGGSLFAEGSPGVCPHCQRQFEYLAFPKAWNEEPGRALPHEPVVDGQAACFFHHERKAALACERCGRFICALCELQIGSERLCPTCLHRGLEGEKISVLVNSRRCWGNISLLFGFVPLVFFVVLWPVMIMSGPLAIFSAIYGWKKPGSLVRGRRRWAMLLGGLAGLAQIGALIGMGIMIWKSKAHG